MAYRQNQGPPHHNLGVAFLLWSQATYNYTVATVYYPSFKLGVSNYYELADVSELLLS